MLVVVLVTVGPVFGQPPTLSSFERIVQYGHSFENLNERYASSVLKRSELITQRDEAQNRLLESQRDFEQVTNKNASAQSAAMQQAELMLRSRFPELDPNLRGPTRGAQQQAVFATQLQSASVLQGLEQQIRQLDVATQLIFERRFKILSRLQDISEQAERLSENDRKLIQQYLEMSDVSGVRSLLELKAAHRELQGADAKNLGASCALAITLIRMEQVDAAEDLLESLRAQSSIRPMVLAMQGDILASRNEKQAAKKQFNLAIQAAPNDPYVRLLRAHGMSIIEEAKQASADWEFLLKSNKFEIDAHRGLAFVYSTMQPTSDRSRQQAMEHAKLASALSGEIDWSSQIALALATAANGDSPKAATLAEKAADLTVAENRDRCLNAAQVLRDGNAPGWKFDTSR